MSSLFKQLKIKLRRGSESCDLGYVSTTYVDRTKEERPTELENKECTKKKQNKTKRERFLMMLRIVDFFF